MVKRTLSLVLDVCLRGARFPVSLDQAFRCAHSAVNSVQHESGGDSNRDSGNERRCRYGADNRTVPTERPAKVAVMALMPILMRSLVTVPNNWARVLASRIR